MRLWGPLVLLLLWSGIALVSPAIPLTPDQERQEQEVARGDEPQCLRKRE